ncbi:MAG: putative addiction module component (TIGR02574 family) [Saprospiraceae bacterium]|jgi:putative addiction module component (TIGR02574 family)|tara:strand:+ start:1597 stop:1806 length:210 start_codon:yes stop_codon:yes gene_type:complete
MSITEILELSSAEKILLVEQIWDSLDPNELQITKAQKQELDRRIALDNNEQMSWHSWSEVKSHLQSIRK